MCICKNFFAKNFVINSFKIVEIKKASYSYVFLLHVNDYIRRFFNLIYIENYSIPKFLSLKAKYFALSRFQKH